MVFVQNDATPIWDEPEHNIERSIPITGLRLKILNMTKKYGPTKKLPFPQEFWTIYAIISTEDLAEAGIKRDVDKLTKEEIDELAHNIPDDETLEKNIHELDGKLWIFIEGN